MVSSAAETAYATGLFNAFMAYKKKYDKNSTIPYRPEPTEKKVEIPQVVPQDEVKVKPSKKQKMKEPEPVKVVEVKDTTIVEQPVDSVAEEVLAVQPVAVKQPVVESPSTGSGTTVETPQPPVKAKPARPIYKVQILASSSKIKVGDARLKGLKNTEYYQEGGLYKYTVGSSEDFNEMNRLRREIAQKFPEAFIVAFKDGVRMDVNEARRGKK